MNNSKSTQMPIQAKTDLLASDTSVGRQESGNYPEMPSPEDVATLLTGGGGKPIGLQDEFGFLAGIERKPKAKRDGFRVIVGR